MSSRVWIAGFGDLGESIEVTGEMAAFFEPLGPWWSIGPIAGVGADWSDKPGVDNPPIATYLISAAGVATTLNLDPKAGLWGYAKYQFSVDNAYQSDWIGGVGLWLKF